MVKHIKKNNEGAREKFSDTGVLSGHEKVRSKGKYIKKYETTPRKPENFFRRIFKSISEFFIKPTSINTSTQTSEEEVSNLHILPVAEEIKRKRGRPKKVAVPEPEVLREEVPFFEANIGDELERINFDNFDEYREKGLFDSFDFWKERIND